MGLIDPLKKNLEEHIHDTNSSGTSCWQLLTGLDVKIKILKQETISSSTSSDSETSSEAIENEWNEKLKQAHEEDNIVNFGKYSESQYKMNIKRLMTNGPTGSTKSSRRDIRKHLQGLNCQNLKQSQVLSQN